MTAPINSNPARNSDTPLTKSQKKNIRRKEKQQEKRAEAQKTSIEFQYSTLASGDKSVDDITKSLAQTTVQPAVTYDASTPPEVVNKQLKKLNRKIREMDQLQAKFDSKEIPHLNSAEKAKLARRDEVNKQITELQLLLKNATSS